MATRGTALTMMITPVSVECLRGSVLHHGSLPRRALGLNAWGPTALEAGFCFARLLDSTLAHMEEIGWPMLPPHALRP